MNRKRTTDDQTEAIDLSAVLNAKAVVPTPEAPVTAAAAQPPAVSAATDAGLVAARAL